MATLFRVNQSVSGPWYSTPARSRYRTTSMPMARSSPASRPVGAALRGAAPRGQHGAEDAVGQRRLQRIQHLDARDEIRRAVGDALDPVGVELGLGVHQAHALEAEVLRDAHGARDIDDVL